MAYVSQTLPNIEERRLALFPARVRDNQPEHYVFLTVPIALQPSTALTCLRIRSVILVRQSSEA